MHTPDVSRRGVYYNLEISPYRFTSPDGDIFKFSSAKKLEIYNRRIIEFFEGLDKLLEKHSHLGEEWQKLTRYEANSRIYDIIYEALGRGF